MQEQSLRYLLILDFEATCGDVIRGQNEIIEFPTLVYDMITDEVISTFHEYVQPVLYPTLTPFCTRLTGITQDVVDAAQPFANVWKRFQEFMKSHDLGDPTSFTFLTCGNWDLRTMLPAQLALSAIDGVDPSGDLLPPYNRFINIKDAYRKHYRLRYNNSMLAMLQGLKLELEGRHHSGIDDCKNILRIVRKMREDGWKP
ncbi:hypothetical protein AcW1_000758 [Taiwanofungus camphoratus]|nr:hypothetical protein AcW1_000758 [Antrodia cinnamomea]